MKTWRVYLVGRHTRLITNHASLQFFHSQKPLTPRQARWKEDMASAEFDTHHRPGKSNTVADTLSRRPDFQLNTLTVLTQSDEMLKALQTSYQHDSSASKQTTQLRDGIRYHVDGKGSERIYIPENARRLQQDILEPHHDAPAAGHRGKDRTLASIGRYFYCPNMAPSITEYINTCDACQHNKPSNL